MTGSLAALLAQAEADRWGPMGLGPVLQANQTLIALAPDMARLLVDMAAWIDGKGGMEEGAALLARFAALDEKAGAA